MFSQQLTCLTCQFFDQQFVAAWGSGSDDFLVDAITVAAGGRDVARLPVSCECGDEYGARCESLSQLDLQVLVKFARYKEPEAVTGDADGDIERADRSRGECFEAGDLACHLFRLGSAPADFCFIAASACFRFLCHPVVAAAAGFIEAGQVVSPWQADGESVPGPAAECLADFCRYGFVCPASDPGT